MLRNKQRYGACSGALVVSLSMGALAQSPPAGEPSPPSPVPSSSVPASAFPPAPAAEPPAPAAGPFASPSYGSAAPPPAYAPPPQQWPAPAPYYLPPPAPKIEATELAARGPYFGAWLGAGGPFGSNTTTNPGSSYTEGVGVMGAAGYAFIPNFGVDLFLHYNHSSLSSSSSFGRTLDENSGHVLLYGIEARGIVGSGPLLAWASLGVSLGSGSLGLSSTTPGAVAQSGPSQASFTVQNDATVDFSPMPVLAFGAEMRLTEGLSVGPQVRWYVVSAHQACDDVHVTPSIGITTSPQCTAEFGTLDVPDIVFVGVGLSYHLALGG